MCIQCDTMNVGKKSLTKINMPTINVRTDAKLKRDAAKVLNEMGLDLSRAIKMFLHQVVITESVPFPVRTVNGFTIEEEMRLKKEIVDMEKKIKAGKVKMYDSAEEMTDDILKNS